MKSETNQMNKVQELNAAIIASRIMSENFDITSTNNINIETINALTTDQLKQIISNESLDLS